MKAAMASAQEKKVLLLLQRATSETADNYAHRYWKRFNKSVLWEACCRLDIDDKAAPNSINSQLADIIEAWIKSTVSRYALLRSCLILLQGLVDATIDALITRFAALVIDKGALLLPNIADLHLNDTLPPEDADMPQQGTLPPEDADMPQQDTER
jgi:hypothetical protein